MTITVSLLDVAVTLGLAAVLTATVVFVRLAARMGRTADRLDRTLEEVSSLVPHTRRVLDEGAGELRALRTVTDRSADVVDDLSGISEELRQGVAVLDLAKRSQAVVAGAKAGYRALRDGADR